MKMGGNDLMRN